MNTVVLAHGELTKTFLHRIGLFLQKYDIPIQTRPRDAEEFAAIAAHTVDILLREQSAWLPRKGHTELYHSLYRVVPELIEAHNRGLDDVFLDEVEWYRQVICDALHTYAVNWQWESWTVSSRNTRIVTVTLHGDRRIQLYEEENANWRLRERRDRANNNYVSDRSKPNGWDKLSFN